MTQYVKLADICSLKTGKLNSNAAVKNGAYPFFTCAQETYQIDEAAFNTEAVILGGNNANGVYPLKYYNGEFNAYQRTYILETLNSESLNIRFLFYSLSLALTYFQKASIGATTQYLTKPVIDNFKIYLPKIEQQKKIVNLLSKYDDLIENNRCRIQLLEESARLLYKEWFVHLRFPGHEHVKIVDGVPEGWVKEPLENLLVLQRGFDLPHEKREEGKVPIYASTGINGYHKEAKVIGPGVITGRSGSLGSVIYVSKDYWPLNTTLWVKEFKKVDPIFTTFLLRHMKLENYNAGAAVPTLNRNDVHKVNVLCPNSRLIEMFTEQVKPVFFQIEKLNELNHKLAQARDLLLPRLMNGELTL